MQRDYGVYWHRAVTFINANGVKHLWRQAIKVQLFGNVFENPWDLLVPKIQYRWIVFNGKRPMENWQLFYTFTFVWQVFNLENQWLIIFSSMGHISIHSLSGCINYHRYNQITKNGHIFLHLGKHHGKQTCIYVLRVYRLNSCSSKS